MPPCRSITASSRWSRSPDRSYGLCMVSLWLIALSFSAVAQKPDLAAPDETLSELYAGLAASSNRAEPITMQAYLADALRILRATNPCLSVVDKGSTTTIACGKAKKSFPTSPQSPEDTATFITAALDVVHAQSDDRLSRREAICRSAAKLVGDPFTAYFTPAAVKASDVNVAGPGIEMWPKHPTEIRSVVPGGPAYNMGIRPGDHVKMIDGVDISELVYFEVQQKLMGPVATSVVLDVEKKAGGGDVVHTLNRTQAPQRSVRLDAVSDPEGRILYVHLPGFFADTPKQVSDWLSKNPTAVGLVLDLRQNPGGLIPSAVKLLDLFLSDGYLAGIRTKKNRPTDDNSATPDFAGIPLVVMVDGGSASAAELTAMVLRERGRAKVVGYQTAGKGTVQQQIRLPDGGLLKVTAGYYVGPNETRLPDDGLVPNPQLIQTQTGGVLEGGDPAKDAWVQAAIEVLRGRASTSTVRSPEPHRAGPGG
jgi:carboxyl-terminal processing protease